MDNDVLMQVAQANLPSSNKCALTGNDIVNSAVMHRDLSDFWPTSLEDMRDDRLNNILIVERRTRDAYYNKLKNTGIALSFSGGLDSTTVLHWAIKLFGEVHCVIFDYGQRHSIEVTEAKEYIESLQCNAASPLPAQLTYEIVKVDAINQLAESSLTREEIDVPEQRSVEEMGEGLPNTYVPGRNVYFITAIAQAAYVRGWRHMAMGVNVLDYSGYPDCRPEFVDAMRTALTIGVFNGQGIGVHAPLMYLNKSQIIRLGLWLGVDYSLTHSCYNGVPGGCGECDSCILRRKAFEDLGMVDPVIGAHEL